MQDEAKKRLAGAVVLVVLVVIFVPMFFEGGSLGPAPDEPPAPPEPTFDSGGYELPSVAPVEALSDPDSFAETAPFGQGSEASGSDMTRPTDLSAPPQTAAPAVATVPLTADSVDAVKSQAAMPQPEPVTPRPEANPQPAKPVVTKPQRPRSQPKPQPVTPTPKPTPAVAERPVRKAPLKPSPKPDLAAPPVPDGSAWIVQVASLSSASSASALADKLRSNGFNAFVEQARINGKTWHRVRVGPVAERGAATSLEARLRAQQGLETLVQRYR